MSEEITLKPRDKEREQKLWPQPDIEGCAADVKKYIDLRKMDHVDYAYEKIQMFPPSDQKEELPALADYAEQFEALFNYLDEVVPLEAKELDDDLKELVAAYDARAVSIADLVNGDKEFWDKLRDEIIPLYDKSKDYDYWKGRWKACDFYYDAGTLTVETKKNLVDKNTGEVVSSEVVRTTKMPPGFVIKIN